nr:hypothetical protein [Tanacetum cinerariifolium]
MPLANDEFLNQYNTTLARQVAMGSQLRKNHIKILEALLEAEVGIKDTAEAKNVKLVMEWKASAPTAFEEFKKYEDDRVSSQCAKIDARLDALSIDFDEELYPHILTAIMGHRWVIRHGLRLAIMKLKHGLEHMRAMVDLAAIEACNPEADTKYVAALHALKDLKYPIVDQLEKFKDAPIDVIMSSLFLESDSGEDAPQWIHEFRPSSSQLKIPVYPEVMCHTHGVGSAHHARSDGIPVSVPTVASQGLAILLADAVTQTEITEDEASPRLIRSKSLPPLYILDWP